MSHLRIGISANFFYPDESRKAYAKKTLAFLEQGMCDFFANAGAIPYMIPKIAGKVTTSDAVAEMDGIVFAGGADLCPRTYGEEPLKPEWEGDAARDAYEIALFKAARELKKPVLGICRGMQLINVALGGTLYQDIATQVDTDTTHRCAHAYDNLKHDIDILPDTALSYIFEGRDKALVNSVHHQAVKDLGKGLIVEAVSSTDGIVEAVRLDAAGIYVMAVQWHPEFSRNETKPDADALLTHYLNAVQSRKSG
jgi:putative glutamine amidotransferase